MKVIKTPPQRARITVVSEDANWGPGCYMGQADHMKETMEVGLGKDDQGRAISLLMKPSEAAALVDAIQKAIKHRMEAYVYPARQAALAEKEKQQQAKHCHVCADGFYVGMDLGRCPICGRDTSLTGR